MSLTEKLGSLMARPNEDLVSKDDVSVWMKYAARALGTAGGGIAIFLGAWEATGIAFADVGEFLGGVWQMLAGFLLITVEAPCCCMFLDFVAQLSQFVDGRPYWNRAALYVILALPPIFLGGFDGSVIFGSGLIFATGVLYGLMALGKKAPIEQMRTNAANNLSSGPSFLKASLVDGQAPMGSTPHFTGVVTM